jgi:hypothetical protein
MPISDALDREIRTAAFIHVRRMLELRDPLTSEDLARGFLLRGERIVIPAAANCSNGPGSKLLSIKTVVPRKGARPR